MLNALTALVHRTSYTDLCYGFNAFWRRILPYLALEVGDDGERRWGDGFEIETMLNIRVRSADLKVTEVPSFEGSPAARGQQPERIPGRLARAVDHRPREPGR